MYSPFLKVKKTSKSKKKLRRFQKYFSVCTVSDGFGRLPVSEHLSEQKLRDIFTALFVYFEVFLLQTSRETKLIHKMRTHLFQWIWEASDGPSWGKASAADVTEAPWPAWRKFVITYYYLLLLFLIIILTNNNLLLLFINWIELGSYIINYLYFFIIGGKSYFPPQVNINY